MEEDGPDADATEIDVQDQLEDLDETRKRPRRNEHKEPATANLHPRDPENFLKLASALNILLADFLNDEQIEKADTLL